MRNSGLITKTFCASGRCRSAIRGIRADKCLVDCRYTTVDEVAAWIGKMHVSGHGGHSGAAKSTSSTHMEIAANAALILINVAATLLDRQIASQAAAFEKEGGFTERLYRIRSKNRRLQ